ncbi:hypothetical protein I4U23_014268 [Adineta vaga]|nr:hypothetical protein I4U23_014268 [Adineta vaga]
MLIEIIIKTTVDNDSFDVYEIGTTLQATDSIISINDVDKHLHGSLEATRRWFKYYKVPNGKTSNTSARNEQYGDRAYAQHVTNKTKKY